MGSFGSTLVDRFLEMTRVPFFRRLFSLPQERDQVGHLLEADGLLESLGHEGLAGGAELVDLGAEQGFLDPLGAAELQGRGGLFGEQSRDDLAARVASESVT